MSSALWVSMPIIRNTVISAVKNATQLQTICNMSGITLEDLENPHRKVTLQENYIIMDAAYRCSGDEYMGLHIGEKTSAVVLGTTGYLMESSKTILEALKNLQQYNASVTQLFSFSTEIKNNEVIFYAEPIEIWNETSPDTARQSVDMAFAGLLHIIKLLTGKMLHPHQVFYRYNTVPNTQEYERILKCKPRFNQHCNCMFFTLQQMQHPVIGYNKELNLIFKNLLDQELHKKQQQENFTVEVRKIILQQYQFVFPQLDQIAGIMHLTPRTLQRKLRDENTSFRALTDSIRQEIAAQLLANKSLSISDIAYKLGYSEISAFQRAFRQWTGKTPGAYRTASVQFAR